MMGITSHDLARFVQQLQARKNKVSTEMHVFLQRLYASILRNAWEHPAYSFRPQGLEEYVSHPLRKFDENVVPRRRVQRELANVVMKNTVAIDAGYLGTEGYTERDGIISLGVIGQRSNKTYSVRRTILFPPDFRSRHLSLMGAAEVNAATCLISWIMEGESLCNQFEIEKDGINEEFCAHDAFRDLKGQGELIITLDRPLFPYHLWGEKGKSKISLIDAYESFYETIAKIGAHAYSVISSSMQKSIIEVIAESINGEGRIKNARPLLLFLENWVRENENTALAMLEELTGIDSVLLSSWNDDLSGQTIARLLLGMLAEKLDDGSPYLKDYDVFDKKKFKFEDRSTAWTLNPSRVAKGTPEAFVASLAKGLDLSFFYVSYGKMYSRVEFTSSDPMPVYAHYLLMTSRTRKYYPLHLELAHKQAVFRGQIKRALLSMLLESNSGVPGPKLLSKIGGYQGGTILEPF